MSNKARKLIQDLITFYVKENYNHHLKENKLEKIENEKIEEVVKTIYYDKKDHLKEFLKISLKEVMKDDYIGDLALLNITTEIFSDDALCINRLILELKNYQDNK